MRTGRNPQKDLQKIKMYTQHRVVVVVFIPELDGYYEKALEVFRLCLNSLIKNNSGNYKITVVNNGSCFELKELLESYSENQIDCIISHSSNIGKIDALIGAARGSREDYITLTDSDILFLKNWDGEIMNIFQNFKNVGSVSPIPFRHGLYYGTSSTLKDVVLNRVKFHELEIPENFDDHNKYLSSINWGGEKDSSIKWPVIERNDVRAIIGSGHQVLTIKRDILFKTVPIDPSLTLVGGNSEYKYIDEPIDKSGRLRLSTFRNLAYHMGNEVESWMLEKLEDQIPEVSNVKDHFTYSPENDKIKSDLWSNFNHKIYEFKKTLIKNLFRIYYKN